MREIKFRAWNRVYETMEQWNHVRLWEALGQLFVSDEYVFMQFTGLTLPDGTEIYEGDILAYFFNERISDSGHIVKERGYEIHPVIFHNSAFVLTELDDLPLGAWINDEEFEILGNIYEHPELIEKP